MAVPCTRSIVESFWETKSDTARIVRPMTVQRRSWLPETRYTLRTSSKRAMRVATSSNPTPRAGASDTSMNAVTVSLVGSPSTASQSTTAL